MRLWVPANSDSSETDHAARAEELLSVPGICDDVIRC